MAEPPSELNPAYITTDSVKPFLDWSSDFDVDARDSKLWHIQSDDDVRCGTYSTSHLLSQSVSRMSHFL